MLPLDDSALREGRGCYGTTRVTGGAPLHLERQVRRLCRDARRLGFAALDPDLCVRAFCELAEAAFPEGEGIVRVQVSAGHDGAPRLLATARSLGPDPDPWRAARAPYPHEGPGPFPGVKLTNRLRFAEAAAQARASGCDEAIFFDAAGWLVEGSRSNLAVVCGDGSLRTPPIARGGVAGVAREVALERVAELREGDVDEVALASARELVALNGARGARAIVALDGRPVGDGRPGPWAGRLAQVYLRD